MIADVVAIEDNVQDFDQTIDPPMKAIPLVISPTLPQFPSPRLPEEIVSEILVLACEKCNPSDLVDLELFKASAAFASSPSTVALNRSVSGKAPHSLSMRTQQLCSYALVCRTWSDASLPFLYSASSSSPPSRSSYSLARSNLLQC